MKFDLQELIKFVQLIQVYDVILASNRLFAV